MVNPFSENFSSEAEPLQRTECVRLFELPINMTRLSPSAPQKIEKESEMLSPLDSFRL